MPRFLAGADPRRMTHCPACGSHRFEPVDPAAARVTHRIVSGVLFQQPALGPAAKRCLDCKWQVA